MKDKSEVKSNPKPVFYAVLLESFRKIALDMGYALTVHGTMANDMDLLAVAWTENVKPHEELVNALWDEIGNTTFRDEESELMSPTFQPHGRVTYTIPIIGDYYIDLSIIPTENDRKNKNLIDTSREYVTCSAIHYDNHKHYPYQNTYGIKSGFVLCGFRHPIITSVLPTNIYFEKISEFAKEFAVKWSKGKVDNEGKPIPECTQNGKTYQGFLTSLGRFVDRKEAAIIAIECGQIKELNWGSSLYSEDIFPQQAIRSED